MKIAHLDTDHAVVIVAEIGNNHEGNFESAKRMISLAAESGADIVKFQTIRADKFVSKKNEQRYNTLKKFELSDRQHFELAQTAKDCGVLFLSTPFDLDGVAMLNPLVPAFKVASGDNTFFPLIERIAKTGKPIILSTGLVTMAEIRHTKDFIAECWRDANVASDLALLHCVVAYPTPPIEANLAAIRALGEEFNCTIGYSDHTLGIEAAVLAVAAGARIIEKHFTLSKDHSAFRDHQLSADPEDMKELVRQVRRAELLLGEGIKEPQESEVANLIAVRRSIVAARSMEAGHVICEADLNWMRPGGGIAPGDERTIIGKTVTQRVDEGDQILLTNVR